MILFKSEKGDYSNLLLDTRIKQRFCTVQNSFVRFVDWNRNHFCRETIQADKQSLQFIRSMMIYLWLLWNKI